MRHHFVKPLQSILVTLWYSQSFRLFLIQLLILAFITAGAFKLWQNLQLHLKEHEIELGFNFLNDTAGFSILMHLIEYSEKSSYGRAFLVGLINTLVVSGLGIIFATFIGLIVGIASIARNRLIAILATIYIEIVRNIPLLLQLFFWYFVVLRSAPLPQNSISIFNLIFITNRGIYLPTFTSSPILSGLNFEGGMVLLPEFLALLIALSIYTGSYIAEIIRLGVLSVEKSQKEAATALGLSNWQSFRLVILPQSLKVILPPLTNQYLNLIKNSSLAVAIAYPDLVGVFAGTVLNQSGHAIEIMVITMAVYLFINVCISGLMLLYEKRTKWWLKT